MNWKEQAIVAFDTETTGLKPFDGDRIIEVAAVVFRLDEDGTIVSREEHSYLINPGRDIPPKVTEITGITNEDVVEAPPFEAVAQEIHQLLEGAITVAHNYAFDLNFLQQEFRRANLSWPNPLAEIDTLDLSMRCFPHTKGHKLNILCKRLDVTLDQAHRATADATACGECFVALTKRHEVATSLDELLDWANAIGRPPEGEGLHVAGNGLVVFDSGPYEGESIATQPHHLHWMTKARTRGPQGWEWTFSDSIRRWSKRWLDVRGSGPGNVHPRTPHPQTWGMDSAIVPDKAKDHSRLRAST